MAREGGCGGPAPSVTETGTLVRKRQRTAAPGRPPPGHHGQQDGPCHARRLAVVRRRKASGTARSERGAHGPRPERESR